MQRNSTQLCVVLTKGVSRTKRWSAKATITKVKQEMYGNIHVDLAIWKSLHLMVGNHPSESSHFEAKCTYIYYYY